jgi:hypothetical protein
MHVAHTAVLYCTCEKTARVFTGPRSEPSSQSAWMHHITPLGLTNRTSMAQQLQLALTKNKQPRLAALLEAAKPCKLGAVKRYLTAGGTLNAVIDLEPQHTSRLFEHRLAI